MDSGSKPKDVNESDTSRFTLDGVVAEMVIEVDEEEAISPTKTLKLNGIEKYEALKASALRKSSVVLDSRISNSGKGRIQKRKGMDSDKSGKDIESNALEESKEDSETIESTSKVVDDTKCPEEKSENLADESHRDLEDLKKSEDLKMPSDASEVKHSVVIENQDPVISEKQESKISNETDLSKAKQSKSLGKRKCRVYGNKASKDLEKINSEVSEETELKRSELLSEESAMEESSKKSSNRNKSKNVENVEERETRSSANKLNRGGNISHFKTASPENKKNTLRTRLQTNGKQKRKLPEQELKNETTTKKQKRADGTPKTTSGLKFRNSVPSISEATTSRRHSPRKPLSPSTAKLKAFNLYPKSDYRLDSFAEVKEQLNVADLKYLRALYRIMYDRWPPKDLEELKKEILQFQGFTFNRKSDELEKRQLVLKKLPDASVLQVCKILDLKEGSKDTMVSDIMKFLLKPTKIIYSVVDPFQSSMQPVVKLEKMSLDDKYFCSVRNLDEMSNKEIKASKRKRFPSSRLSEYVSDIDSFNPETKTSNSGKVPTLAQTEVNNEKKSGRPKRKVNSSQNADGDFDKVSPKKIKTYERLGKETSPKAASPIDQNDMEGNKVHSPNKRKVLMALAAKIQNSKSPVKTTSEDALLTMDIKEEIVVEPDLPIQAEIPASEAANEKPDTRDLTTEQISPNIAPEDTSNKLTLSSDEAKKEQATQEAGRKKKVLHKRSVKPLRCFNEIKENILTANFSALQRLHILLFGASDKVENLKSNILSFGGFPFLAGSEEWKQKEFLLSLLAQNTLREYLNLLCIEHGDEDNHALINKLMRFLAAPKDKDSEEIITQVISSEPINQAAIQITQNTRSVLKKKVDSKPVVVKKSARVKNKKVLMDEEQVRRLEREFEREQRILEREKRQTEKLKLMNELNSERSGAKSGVKYCQAINCHNNSKDHRELSFFSFPNEPARLKKWLSNVKLKSPYRKYNAFLCSKHFDVRAFTNTCKNSRLLRCAVPTVPAPGSSWAVKYPCLDGYSTPGTSRVRQGSSPIKKDAGPSTSLTMSIDVDTIPGYEPGSKSYGKSPDKKKQAPLQKVIGDMTKKRASMMAQQTDSELLDALLQTVYKRRALKSAGAIISIPNKGVHTRLGELDNVKFLVVTANYNDLDVLHHLIYMTEATKTRVRKNILDFAGFNFAEDSTPYKDRMEFLKSLGYDISKRIGFLLGLCPYKMDIPQQDLNELIMYFLMSPCKSKQVPIRHLPHNFFTKDMPKELCLLLQKHGESAPDNPKDLALKPTSGAEIGVPSVTLSSDDSPPKILLHQKAKKSFRSSPLIKRNISSTSVTSHPSSPSLSQTRSPRGRPPGKRPFRMPSILGKPPAPAPPPPPPPPPPTTTAVRPLPLQKSILKSPVMVSSPKTSPHEFLIQQQTSDGQQKTYKLIKLPSSHPLNSAIKTPHVQSQLLPQLHTNTPIAGPPLPPGIIVFKNSPAGNLHTVVNPTSQIQLSTPQPNFTVKNPELTIAPVVTDPSSSKKPAVPEASSGCIPLQFDYNEKVEVLHPLEDNDPTDEELYSSIQEIIHNSNFEDITLRNVIDRVSAQYAAFDLSKRHAFMKECVKKIIIGT